MSQYTTTKWCCGKKTQTHSRVCIEHVVTGRSTSHSLVLCSKLINRLLSSVLNFDSLWEALFHFKPDLSQLRTFACTCYILLRPYNKHKLQFRTTPCLFSGYPSDTKGYICFDPNTLRKFTYLDMFYLMKFISLHLPLQLLLPLSLLNHGFLLSFTGIYVLLLFITLLLPIMLPHHFPLLPHQNLSLLLLPESASDLQNQFHSSPIPTPNVLPVTTSLVPLPNLHPMQTRSKSGITKPNQKWCYKTIVVNNIIETPSFNIASKFPNWCKAMDEEFQALR